MFKKKHEKKNTWGKKKRKKSTRNEFHIEWNTEMTERGCWEWWWWWWMDELLICFHEAARNICEQNQSCLQRVGGEKLSSCFQTRVVPRYQKSQRIYLQQKKKTNLLPFPDSSPYGEGTIKNHSADTDESTYVIIILNLIEMNWISNGLQWIKFNRKVFGL